MTRWRLVACVGTIATAMATAACSTDPEFALIIHGGMVIDGTGGAPISADVGVKGDRIAAIGDLANRSASTIIDAAGKTVAPGFIDVDSGSGVALIADGFAESHLRQGITTEVVGATDIDGYARALESRGTAVNVGTLVPLAAAPAGTAASAFIDAALGAGALGIAAGAQDTPDRLAQAAALVARHDAILTVPVENSATQADESLLALAAQAKNTAVEGLSRLTSTDMVIAVVRRMITASERQTPIYGLLTSNAASGATGDVVMSAAKYGGVLISPSLVRDAHAIELREGIRRVTSMAAAAFQIAQRGIIRENYFADLVVFEPAKITAGTEPDNPASSSSGVDYVVVNGVVALTPRGLTGSRPGYALLHGRSAR